jgi:hypothetical protein
MCGPGFLAKEVKAMPMIGALVLKSASRLQRKIHLKPQHIYITVCCGYALNYAKNMA